MANIFMDIKRNLNLLNNWKKYRIFDWIRNKYQHKHMKYTLSFDADCRSFDPANETNGITALYNKA